MAAIMWHVCLMVVVGFYIQEQNAGVVLRNFKSRKDLMAKLEAETTEKSSHFESVTGLSKQNENAGNSSVDYYDSNPIPMTDEKVSGRNVPSKPSSVATSAARNDSEIFRSPTASELSFRSVNNSESEENMESSNGKEKTRLSSEGVDSKIAFELIEEGDSESKNVISDIFSLKASNDSISNGIHLLPEEGEIVDKKGHKSDESNGQNLQLDRVEPLSETANDSSTALNGKSTVLILEDKNANSTAELLDENKPLEISDSPNETIKKQNSLFPDFSGSDRNNSVEIFKTDKNVSVSNTSIVNENSSILAEMVENHKSETLTDPSQSDQPQNLFEIEATESTRSTNSSNKGPLASGSKSLINVTEFLENESLSSNVEQQNESTNTQETSTDLLEKEIQIVESEGNLESVVSAGIDFLVNSEVAKNVALAIDVFNLSSDTSLSDHLIENSDLHSLVEGIEPELLPQNSNETSKTVLVDEPSNSPTNTRNESIVKLVEKLPLQVMQPVLNASLSSSNEKRHCPPSAICLFWFLARDTCANDSECQGTKVCCRIRCSKQCIEILA